MTATTKLPSGCLTRGDDDTSDIRGPHKRARESAEGALKRRVKSKKQGLASPPSVNTWVVVSAETRRKRDKLASQQPALVTAVAVEDGQATVVYPNPLVLIHGFAGSPLKRIIVPFERLSAFTGDSSELKHLEEQLFKSVKVAASQPCSSRPLSDAEPSTPTSSPKLHEDDSNATLVDEEAEPRVPMTPEAARTPANDSQQEVMAADTPCKREQPVILDRKRFAEFTKLVSQQFSKARKDQLSKDQLMAACTGFFSADEFCTGMDKLEALSKVFVVDEVVWIV